MERGLRPPPPLFSIPVRLNCFYFFYAFPYLGLFTGLSVMIPCSRVLDSWTPAQQHHLKKLLSSYFHVNTYFNYRGFYEKGTLSYLCELGIDSCLHWTSVNSRYPLYEISCTCHLSIFLSSLWWTLTLTVRNIDTILKCKVVLLCIYGEDLLYRQFHKTLPKSYLQMHLISVRFYEMGDM